MRKLTQEEVAKYFKDNGYELLSEYVGSKQKVTISNIKKEEFNITFSSFRRGSRPEKRVKRITQEEAVEYFKEQGYELLSEYTNNTTKVSVRNSNGEEYEVSLNGFKQGSRPERRTNKYTQEEIEGTFSKYGYTVIGTYNSSAVPLEVLCINNHNWKVSLTNFKHGNRCPFCNSIKIGGMSKGERMVWSILNANKDTFKNIDREITVNINGNIHRLDFVTEVNDKTYAIEYDGLQHYKEKTYGSWLYNTDKISERDNAKDEYCKSNGMEMLRIPYTFGTVDSIITIMSGFFGIKLNMPERDSVPYLSEVARYYLDNTLKETVNKYKLSHATICKYFRAIYGIDKRKYIRDNAVEYYLKHSSSNTTKKYGMSRTGIERAFKEVYGMTKTEYLKQQKLKGLY